MSRDIVPRLRLYRFIENIDQNLLKDREKTLLLYRTSISKTWNVKRRWDGEAVACRDAHSAALIIHFMEITSENTGEASAVGCSLGQHIFPEI